jgi:hypothetical protein
MQTDQLEGADAGSVRSVDADQSTATPEQTATDSRPVRLLYPEYGPVEALVGFGVFALIVEWLTPALVAALAGPVPDLVPEPLTTVTAVLLWVALGATVAAIVLPLLDANPRTFDDRRERDAFLDENRPSDRDYRVNLALMVLGGATAVLAWPTFVAVLRETVPVVVALGGPVPTAWTPGNVAIFAVFVLGVAAYSRGLDRLLVGGMREFLYRYHADDWE